MKNFTSSVAAATLSTHKPHVPLVAITSDSAAIKDFHRCKIALWCILLARPGPTQCRPHRHVELAFHWQIMKPNLQPLMPGETFSMDSIRCHPDRETAFSIAPESGLLYPHTDHEFILGFSPHEVKMTPSRESRTIGSWHVHPLSLLLSDTEARVGPDHIPSTLLQPARGRAGLGDALPVRTRTRVLPGPDPAHTSSAPRPWAHVAALGSSMFLPHRRRRSHPRPVPSSPQRE